MPTYEYRCTKGHRFELFHGIKDESPKKCPRCGARARRVPVGGSGLLFKGTGFHVTDYRSAQYKERAKAEKPEKSEKSGGSKPAGGEGKASKGD